MSGSPRAVDRPGVAGGSETILVVEDNPSLRELIVTLLESAGYTALQEETVDAALALGQRHAARLDLVLTDVMMPGASGRDLAAHFAALRPAVRVLCVSGFRREILVERDLLPPGASFLEKPFSEESLLRTVREILDGPA